MATNDFETKFGILADATLSDKMPSLKKDSIGFQVIASEGDNNEKAVGVSAYKIGSRLIYVPMFWLNGRCKGGETMYLKSEDMFLPFNEVWINFVETGKSFATSEIGRSDSSGKGTPYRVNTMELNRLHTKRAGEVRSFSIDGLGSMFALSDAPEISLREHISMFSPKAAADLAEALTGNSQLANALFLHYTPSEITDILGPRILCGRKQASCSHLEIITDRNDIRVKGLSVDEKRRLVSKGVVIRDGRKEASDAMVVKRDLTRWVTPTEPGWYSALTSSFDVRTVFVIPGIKRYNGQRTAVISKDPEAGWKVNYCGGIYVDQLADSIKGDDTDLMTDATEEAIQEIYRAPADVRYMLFDGVRGIPVHSIREWATVNINGGLELCVEGDDDPAVHRVVLTGKPGSLLSKGSVLYVPTTAKVIRLTGKGNFDPSDNLSATAIENSLLGGGYRLVKVASDTFRYTVSSSGKEASGLTYRDALVSLVKEYGLREKQASDILADANSRDKASAWGSVSFYVSKQAGEYNPSGDDVFTTKETITAGALDNKALSRISEAASSGTKEVLDTKILSELAKGAYPLDRVKDNIPILTKAIDRLGRTLFMFYWHNDAFEDRYGKQNMGSMEDSIKDNLRNLGDLIIYLKEKTTTADEAVASDKDEQDLTDSMV